MIFGLISLFGLPLFWIDYFRAEMQLLKKTRKSLLVLIKLCQRLKEIHCSQILVY